MSAGELEANVDSLIVVLNEKLLDVLEGRHAGRSRCAHRNDVLKNAVGSISEIINEYGGVNVDFEDVRTVMGEPGKAMMGTAAASGPDRARIAAEQAVACPLLEGIDLSGAKGVLVLVTASKGSLKKLVNPARDEYHPRLRLAGRPYPVIYGAAYDDSARRRDARDGGRDRPARAEDARRRAPDAQGHSHRLRTTSPSPCRPSAPASAHGHGHGRSISQPDYGGMAVPSVWRTNRTMAAAKVDALSSGGMDDFEIPAFLRRQAD